MRNHWDKYLNVKELILEYKPRTVLELGALEGHNTLQYLKLREDYPFWMKTISTESVDSLFYEVGSIAEDDRDFQYIQGISYEVIPTFGDNLIEFCSIDTEHTYECLTKELNALLPKLFQRCIVVVHDTQSFPEVRKALTDWLGTHKDFMILRETVESAGAIAICRSINIPLCV